MATPPPDPATDSATVVLGDGETATIRPITPDDAAALDAFHRRQPAENLYRRFFSPKPELSAAELEHFTTIDMVDRVALVVETHGEFIGWASYERWPGRDDADTAFMVDAGEQGKGIATLLLEHLAAIATANGLRRFTAEVLADNRAMLSVFANAGWELERRYDSGVIEVDFAIAETDEFRVSVARREQRADSRAMARLLMPRTIAVVGASDRPGTVGAALWRNALERSSRPVYAVNPGRSEIAGADGQPVPTWPTVAAIPDDVWLAVIAVPAADLAATMRDCATARVRGVVVVTSIDRGGTDGTDDGDADSVDVDIEIDIAAIVAEANHNGIRVIGPSSMGIASPLPSVGLQASLAPVRLAAGRIALSLQSGSLGSSVLRRLEELELGLSWFVSLGDRSDVSGNDLLQFWDDDQHTAVIALYTETLGNPRRFARIARRVSQRRPIVAVRTGAAAVGKLGGALYQQCGLIEVPTVPAMLDTARVLATQPLLAGRHVAVISNSRSPQTLAEAALRGAGLEPVPAPRRLDWQATPGDYTAAVADALADATIDGLIVIHAPPLEGAIGAPVAELDDALAAAAKPATVVLLGARDGPLRPGSTVPAFAFPEPAAAALGCSYAYGRWRDTEATASPVHLDDVDAERVDSVIGAALADDAGGLHVGQTAEVLAAYGIAMPATRFVPAADAVAAADDIGYPVAVKARRRRVGHSVDAGVALDVADSDDVAAVVARMGAALGDDADHVLVQAMTSPGLDLRIRVVVEPEIGPLVTVGIGGSQTDLLDDETPRLAPLSTESAAALLAASRAGPALHGAGIGSGLVVDAILRAGQLVAEHPTVTAVDLNPVIATPTSCVVTDATVRVARVTPTGAALRRL